MNPLILLPFAALTINGPSVQQRVDKFMKSMREAMHIPGLAYAVVKDGKVVQEGAVGIANLTYNVPVTKGTPFLLASITKQFTAAGIMKLVEDGKVSLDAPISTYLGEVPDAWKPITVRHLLTHTAGLKDRFEEKDVRQWKLIYTEATMYEAAKATPVDFPVGDGFQYSDQGFFLLGKIIEEVSKKPYRTFLQDTFFKPTGMKDTTTIALDEIVLNLADGYSIKAKKWIHNNRRTEYGLVSHFGAISTVGDLAKWMIALQNDKPLKHDSIAAMWTPAVQNDGSEVSAANSSYGFGWFLENFNGERIVQHGGSTGTSIYMLPDRHFGVVVLTNLEQLSGGDAVFLSKSIAKMYIPSLAWGNHKPIAQTASSKTLSDELVRVLSLEPLDEAMYDPIYLRMFKPAMAAQKTGLAALGKPKNAELLFDRPGKNVRTLGFVVRYADFGLFATIRVGPGDKIRHLGVEGEDLP